MMSLRSAGTNAVWTGLCWFQGVYYFATGVWPIASVRTFEMVTGEKTDNLITGRESDHWLLMTVSVLILSVSITLLVAAYRRTQALEIAILAVSAAISLTTIDLVYTLRSVISPIDLVDAAIEVPLIITWLAVIVWDARHSRAPNAAAQEVS